MSVLDQVRELDPNDPGRWPLPFRLGAIGLIFIVAVVLLAYFLAWKPKKPQLDAARGEEQQLLVKLEQKAKKAANLDAYKAQLAEMEQSFGAILRKLPNKTEVPNLLTDISQQGTAAGLDQKLFQPNAQVTKDFYAELPIKMRLTGTFHSIGAFVSGIAALPRIVTLHESWHRRAAARPHGEDLSLPGRGRAGCEPAQSRPGRQDPQDCAAAQTSGHLIPPPEPKQPHP
jgi:type IV pilus assembly protein PilO